ncbi:MAG: hypothetical protein ACOYMD_15475 [Paludibacter sp.]
MMNIKTLNLILIILFISFNTFAQTHNRSKLSITFGTRDMWHTPNTTTTNNQLDFINYFDYSDEFPAYEYLEIAQHQWWSSKFESDFKIAVDPGFSPNYLYLKGIYKIKKWLGLSALYVALPQSLRLSDSFENFEPKVNTFIVQTDGKRFYQYDHCFGAGIYAPINYKFIHLNLSLNACIGLSPAYNRTVYLYSYSTNYHAVYDYKIESATTFFILPEVDLNIDFVELGKGTIGLQLKSNWMTTQKSIYYKLNKMEWTTDNSIQLNVKHAPQQITKFEFDGGIYFRW